MRQLSQRALQAFLTTFKAGSISAASTALNLTQPAISRLLKDLEEDLGFPLFHRIRGRLHRTPEGIAFYEEVSRSFVGLDHLQRAADNIRQGHRFRLIVNALPSFASTCMPRILANFLMEYPDTILTARPMRTDEIIDLVRNRECNFGIVETVDFPEGVTQFHVHEDYGQCILPPGHRLEQRDVIEPADLEGEVFIHTIAGSQLGDLVWRMLTEHNVKCQSLIECQLNYFVQKLVREGVGLAIVDPYTAQFHAEIGGVVRPFALPLLNSISFITLESSRLTNTEQRFVDMAISLLNATNSPFTHNILA